MNLVIDIGNTRSKIAVFENNKEIYYETVDVISAKLIHSILNRFPSVYNCIISTVSDIPTELFDILTKKKLSNYILDHTTSLPFTVKYKTPETLGKDRIAAVAGAYALYPGNNVLIIDAGTAITYELVNADNEYLGGNISPGLDMRFKALNQFTAKLPLLEQHDSFSMIGVSTEEAIVNGVQNGLIFEIEGTINALEPKFSNLMIILTGGNASFIDKKLKKSVIIVPNLTLLGLNAILEFNKQ